MIWLYLGLMASASLSFQGRVLSVQKERYSSFYAIQFDTFATPLLASKGPSYDCALRSIRKKEEVQYTFDPKSFQLEDCQKIKATP